MKTWWTGLSPRERWLVGGGSVLAAIFLLYALLWRPFHNRLGELRQTVAAQRRDLAWMQQATVEIKQLGAGAGPPTPNRAAGQPSLLTLVDQTARTAGLGGAMKRIEPQGDDKLRVQFEQVGFDLLIRWLSGLEQDHGVILVNATIDRQADNGRVDARLILQGGPA